MHVQLPEPRAQDGEKDVLSTNLPYTARALTLTLIPSLTITLTPTLTLTLRAYPNPNLNAYPN